MTLGNININHDQECFDCGDTGTISYQELGTLKEFAWQQDFLEEDQSICESCVHGMQHEAEVDEAIYQEDRGIWED